MIGRALVLALAVSAAAGPAAAQVTTHPRAMELPTPTSPRPDPQEHRVELPGGLVAYAAVDGSAPLVTLTAFIGAGYVDGPEGAAEVLARALRSNGPAGMAPGAFAQALRSMVADYSVTLGSERMEISIDVPGEDAWGALALLAGLILRGPEVAAEDIAELRRSVRSSTPSLGADAVPPAAYAGSLDETAELFHQHVLGDTPYGHEPTAAELDELTVDDVQDFHRRFFVAGNVVIAAAGNLTTESLRDALAAGLGGMPRGPRYQRSVTATPTPDPTPQVLTYPADKLQGWLVIGHELPVVPQEDAAALEVMNYILGGGHFDTRLFRATRDRRGLTNDDSGFLSPNQQGPGTYAFHTYGRPGAVRLLLHLTLAEVERIRSELVSEEELFVAKGALADGVFAAQYRDGWSTAPALAAEWLAHGSHTPSASYQERIRSVTAADVLEAARTYLHPDRMQAVLVGPIEAIEAAPPMEDEGALSDYGRVVRGG